MRSTIRLITPLLLLPTLAAPVFAATAAPVSPNCGGSTTPIADIQGPGAPSPLAGQNVSIEAVVTADFGGTDGFGGFFVSRPTRSAATSRACRKACSSTRRKCGRKRVTSCT